jgi:ParB family chromosome partitioning protein
MRPVTIQRIPLDKLVPAPLNANKMPPEVYARLVNAMRKLGGDLQPVLARALPDGMFEIVDGHHRVASAREVGFTDVLCVVSDLTEDEARVLGLGMNRVRGELDLGLASDILVGLPDSVTKEILELSGFSDEELTALLEAGVTHEPDPMGDAMEPEPAPTPAGKFVLELEFQERAQLTKVRRELRRAAGKGGTLAAGLLTILEK